MTIKPPRTEAHTLRAALLQQFADAGLVPVVSTNGGEPDADIEVIKGPPPGDVREVWIKPKGAARLKGAQSGDAPEAWLTEQGAALLKLYPR